MANLVKVSQIIANELLMEFINSSGLTRMVDHQFEKKFGKAGAKIGASRRADPLSAPGPAFQFFLGIHAGRGRAGSGSLDGAARKTTCAKTGE